MVRCNSIIVALTLCLTACAGGAFATTGAAASAQANPNVLTSASLRVTLTSPADETVVNTPQLDIFGQAPADTVITINDAIAVVEASGQFSVSVPLQEGPNELDVIASDRAGNQASSRLIVTYELPVGLLFSAANATANPPMADQPSSTPSAGATKKAGDHATKGQGDQGNGHDNKHTPGAQVTQNAIERATAGQDDNNEQSPTATETPDASATQDQSKPTGDRLTYGGTVSAVGQDSLAISLEAGGSKTVVISPSTKIRLPTSDAPATLADVHVGDPVLAQVLKDDPSQTALFVKVVTGKAEVAHRLGTVTAYTPGVSIAMLDHKGGGSSTFLIVTESKILPEDRANALGIGSLVTIVTSVDLTAGPATAQGIVVHPQEATSTP